MYGRCAWDDLVRSLAELIDQDKIHVVRDGQERLFLVETAIAQAKRAGAGSRLYSSVLKLLRELIQGEDESL
jgi:hypothetical protein